MMVFKILERKRKKKQPPSFLSLLGKKKRSPPMATPTPSPHTLPLPQLLGLYGMTLDPVLTSLATANPRTLPEEMQFLQEVLRHAILTAHRNGQRHVTKALMDWALNDIMAQVRDRETRQRWMTGVPQAAPAVRTGHPPARQPARRPPRKRRR
jgi:hypothetical protein